MCMNDLDSSIDFSDSAHAVVSELIASFRSMQARCQIWSFLDDQGWSRTQSGSALRCRTLGDRIFMQISELIVNLQYGELDLDVVASFREQGDDLLILLHGLGCSKESFEGAFSSPELRSYAICALDFPGHGGSSRHLPNGCYSLEAYADIAGQVIRRVAAKAKRDYSRLCVAGHSMGGAVAVLLPQSERRIASLVSIDGNLIAEDCGLVSRSIAGQSPEQFASQGYSDFRAVLRDSSEPGAQAWARWSASAAPDAMHASARSLVEWSDSGKLLKQFNAVKKNVFLYGERDDKGYLLPRIENAAIATVPGAAHFMMVDNPEAFYRILASALEPGSAGSVAGFRGQDSLQPVP
jgi:pimeloyl-ACP methyl ester carboxylesterase